MSARGARGVRRPHSAATAEGAGVVCGLNRRDFVRIAYLATIARNLIFINFYLDQMISTKYPMDYIEFINIGLFGIRVH